MPSRLWGEQEAEMHHIDILQQVLSSDAALADDDRICPTRRSLLLASLLAALPVTLSEKPGLAGSINPDTGHASRRDQVERLDKRFPAA
jgi:hypothetical protein